MTQVHGDEEDDADDGDVNDDDHYGANAKM